MAETVTITIAMARGYSGKMSGKSYIAKITGTDKTYIFAREFVSTEATDRNECFRARRKGKGTWSEAAALDVGLYEISQYGERRYCGVWIKDGEAVLLEMDEDRAAAIALLMDDGQTFDEARVATKSPTAEVPQQSQLPT